MYVTQSIISAQDAFAALQAKKTVVCRAIGGEFNSLDQFPATIFAMPDYEFALSIDLVEFSGYHITKPISIDEVEEGQEIYIVYPAGRIQRTTFNGHDDLVAMINAGFVQRDFDNAVSQLRAIASVFGIELPPNIEIEDIQLGKKSRRTKKTDNPDVEPVDKVEVVETKPDEPECPEPDAAEPVETAKQAKVEAQQFDGSIIIAGIEKAQTEQALENIAQAINTAYMAHQIDSFKVDELRALIKERKRALLEFELIERAQNSATVTEANGLIRYTRDWTEEQRKPVLDAINARLIELGKQNNAPLLDRVRFAKSLEELKLLESEHDDLDPSDPDFFAIIGALRQRKADFDGDRYIDKVTP